MEETLKQLKSHFKPEWFRTTSNDSLPQSAEKRLLKIAAAGAAHHQKNAVRNNLLRKQAA
jgi:hypothetical protein